MFLGFSVSFCGEGERGWFVLGFFCLGESFGVTVRWGLSPFFFTGLSKLIRNYIMYVYITGKNIYGSGAKEFVL